VSSRVVAFVFARGGSKGVPRKNLRLVAGKPLLAWSIEIACALEDVARVVVSTDDAEIADVARSFGAEVPFLRPAALASDTAPEWLAWQHALREIRATEPCDVLLSLPTTAPLRTIDDVQRCLAALLAEGGTKRPDAVICVTDSARSPYFNMVTLDDSERARLLLSPPASVQRRQDAPRSFDITTVAYAAWADYVLGARGLFDGAVHAIRVPAERALDIDTELDLRIADFLLRERLA
jgi:N,N'-diacetyl-8-epilegionaminate cytidylyltransferase